MAKSFLKFFLKVFFTLGLLTYCFYFLNQKKFFAIDHIDVVLENISYPGFFKPYVAQVDKDLEVLRGNDLWRVNLTDLSGLLSKENWIETIEITRRWPSDLGIVIHPKKVIFNYVWRGEFFPVMSDGSMLSSVGVQQILDTPLLVGEVFVKQEMRAEAIKFISQIPNNGAFTEKNISEIRFDAKEGFVLTLVGTAMTIKMGTDRITLKAARVGQVLEYMQTRQLDARVINANLSKKVLVKLRKAP